MQPNQNDPYSPNVPENKPSTDNGLDAQNNSVSAPINPSINNQLPDASLYQRQVFAPTAAPVATQVDVSVAAPTAQPLQSSNLDEPHLPMPTITSTPTVQPTVAPTQPTTPSLAQPTIGGPSVDGFANNYQTNSLYVGSNENSIRSSQGASGSVNLKPSKIKKILMYFAAAGLFAAVICVVLFVFYIPSLPQNVWKRGFNRTGDESAKLVQAMSKPEAIKAFEKTKIDMTGEVKYGGKKSTMSFDSTRDSANSNNSVKVNVVMPDNRKVKVAVDLNTSLPKDALMPNMYIRIVGFSQLGLEAFAPGINQYENKWIAIEQDFIKQFEESFTKGSTESSKNLSDKEVIGIISDVDSVLQEYLYTSDPEKAVIQLKEFIKTEKSEGIKANHYKAKINKDNFADSCNAIVDKLSANKAIQDSFKLTQDQIRETKKTCNSYAKELSDDFEFDLWIDKKYSLIHKVRFYKDLKKIEKELVKQKIDCLQGMDPAEGVGYCSVYDEQIRKGEEYTEFGQIYLGKDTFKIFAGGMSDTNKDKSDGRISLQINLKTFEVSGEANLNNKSKTTDYAAKLKFKNIPYNGKIESSRPNGAIPIQEIFDKYLGGTPI